jgi:hypothetical protein
MERIRLASCRRPTVRSPSPRLRAISGCRSHYVGSAAGVPPRTRRRTDVPNLTGLRARPINDFCHHAHFRTNTLGPIPMDDGSRIGGDAKN